MQLPDHLREAITAGRPDGLRDELVKLIDGGVDRDDLFNALETFRAELRQVGNEQSEDIVMDLMDYFVGWCRPDLRL